MKVLLVDDHAVVREGLKHILARMKEKVEIGEAGNADSALKLAQRGHWDCALVDIAMPGTSGFELLRQLQREQPGLPVLILSMYPEEQYALRALRAGASGYLNKESAPEQLLGAIQAILRGEKYLSARMAAQFAATLGPGVARPRQNELSNREFLVLGLVASGQGTNDIARQLSLSPKTVSTYRSRIMRKLNISNSSQLIAYAIKNNLTQ